MFDPFPTVLSHCCSTVKCTWTDDDETVTCLISCQGTDQLCVYFTWESQMKIIERILHFNDCSILCMASLNGILYIYTLENLIMGINLTQLLLYQNENIDISDNFDLIQDFDCLNLTDFSRIDPNRNSKTSLNQVLDCLDNNNNNITNEFSIIDKENEKINKNEPAHKKRRKNKKTINDSDPLCKDIVLNVIDMINFNDNTDQSDDSTCIQYQFISFNVTFKENSNHFNLNKNSIAQFVFDLSECKENRDWIDRKGKEYCCIIPVMKNKNELLLYVPFTTQGLNLYERKDLISIGMDCINICINNSDELHDLGVVNTIENLSLNDESDQDNEYNNNNINKISSSIGKASLSVIEQLWSQQVSLTASVFNNNLAQIMKKYKWVQTQCFDLNWKDDSRLSCLKMHCTYWIIIICRENKNKNDDMYINYGSRNVHKMHRNAMITLFGREIICDKRAEMEISPILLTGWANGKVYWQVLNSKSGKRQRKQKKQRQQQQQFNELKLKYFEPIVEMGIIYNKARGNDIICIIGRFGTLTLINVSINHLKVHYQTLTTIHNFIYYSIILNNNGNGILIIDENKRLYELTLSSFVAETENDNGVFKSQASNGKNPDFKIDSWYNRDDTHSNNLSYGWTTQFIESNQRLVDIVEPIESIVYVKESNSCIIFCSNLLLVYQMRCILGTKTKLLENTRNMMKRYTDCMQEIEEIQTNLDKYQDNIISKLQCYEIIDTIKYFIDCKIKVDSFGSLFCIECKLCSKNVNLFEFDNSWMKFCSIVIIINYSTYLCENNNNIIYNIPMMKPSILARRNINKKNKNEWSCQETVDMSILHYKDATINVYLVPHMQAVDCLGLSHSHDIDQDCKDNCQNSDLLLDSLSVLLYSDYIDLLSVIKVNPWNDSIFAFDTSYQYLFQWLKEKFYSKNDENENVMKHVSTIDTEVFNIDIIVPMFESNDEFANGLINCLVKNNEKQNSGVDGYLICASYFECRWQQCSVSNEKKYWKIQVSLTCQNNLSQNVFWRVIHSLSKRIFKHYNQCCNKKLKKDKIPLKIAAQLNDETNIFQMAMKKYNKVEKNIFWRRSFEFKFAKLLETTLAKCQVLKSDWDKSFRNENQINVDLNIVLNGNNGTDDNDNENESQLPIFQVMRKIGDLYEDFIATQHHLLMK